MVAECRDPMAKAGIIAGFVLAVTLLNCWFIFFSFVPFGHRIDVGPEITPSSSLEKIAKNESDLGVVASSPDVSEVEVPRNTDDNFKIDRESPSPEEKQCNIFVGKWEYQPRAPLYTNETCKFIQPSQNCFENGRPDREFLNWKWKPRNCELPYLEPGPFLESMRGKKMVFIGDSIARNHMQSLLCALAQIEEPVKIYFDTKDKEMKWGFPNHDFELANLWSPFLVQFSFVDEIYRLHLDVPENVWASQLDNYDVAVISSAYWYFRPSIYHLNNHAIGCNPRANLNCTILEVLPAYRLAHKNMLKYMKEKFKGITMLRTVTVDHFEFGSWNTGGLCNRTEPFSDPGMEMPWMSNEMHQIQVDEFQQATRDGDVSRLKLLNVTYSSFMRPDGHPGSYRKQELGQPSQNDCLHWCLPGPIDTWNEIISYILNHHQVE